MFLNAMGCAFPWVKESSVKPDDVRDFVDRNYDKFVTTYCGEGETPTAILFDPINDVVTLTGDGWHPVEGRTQVDQMIRDMITKYRFYEEYYSGPYLLEIYSGEGTIIGYYYSMHGNLNLRQDGNNYRVSPITESDIQDERKFYSITGAGYL